MTDIKKIIIAGLKDYEADRSDENKGYAMGIITGAYYSQTITAAEYAKFMEDVTKIGKGVV